MGFSTVRAVHGALLDQFHNDTPRCDGNLRARAKISFGIRSQLDPAGGVTLFGKGTAIACKACLASVAQLRPRYYEIILARALTAYAGSTATSVLTELAIKQRSWDW